jgi:hypothetical protein
MKPLTGTTENVAGMVCAVEDAAFQTSLLALSAALEAAGAPRRTATPKPVRANHSTQQNLGIGVPADDTDAPTELAALSRSLRGASMPAAPATPASRG